MVAGKNGKHDETTGKGSGKGKMVKSAHSYLRYVPCMIEPGMFRGEWLVSLNVRNPDDPEKTLRVQLLVDEHEVVNIQGTPERKKPVHGWLRVAVSDKWKGFTRVVLPQPAEPVGETALMEEDDVKQEAGV